MRDGYSTKGNVKTIMGDFHVQIQIVRVGMKDREIWIKTVMGEKEKIFKSKNDAIEHIPLAMVLSHSLLVPTKREDYSISDVYHLYIQIYTCINIGMQNNAACICFTCFPSEGTL